MSAAIGTWEVALDLVELGRLDEAKTLLDAELPDRLAIPCAACGAAAKQPCTEEAVTTCRFCGGSKKRWTWNRWKKGWTWEPCFDCRGRGEREHTVDRVLPHQSRVLGIARRW